jgi:hypothetical protein
MGCFVRCNHGGSVRGLADGLHASIFTRIVVAWFNCMTVKRAADLMAVFCDGGAGADIDATRLQNLNTVNHGCFFERHFLSFQLFQSDHPT